MHRRVRVPHSWNLGQHAPSHWRAAGHSPTHDCVTTSQKPPGTQQRGAQVDWPPGQASTQVSVASSHRADGPQHWLPHGGTPGPQPEAQSRVSGWQNSASPQHASKTPQKGPVAQGSRHAPVVGPHTWPSWQQVPLQVRPPHPDELADEDPAWDDGGPDPALDGLPCDDERVSPDVTPAELPAPDDGTHEELPVPEEGRAEEERRLAGPELTPALEESGPGPLALEEATCTTPPSSPAPTEPGAHTPSRQRLPAPQSASSEQVSTHAPPTRDWPGGQTTQPAPRTQVRTSSQKAAAGACPTGRGGDFMPGSVPEATRQPHPVGYRTVG
jgi:hypothetical protein